MLGVHENFFLLETKLITLLLLSNTDILDGELAHVDPRSIRWRPLDIALLPTNILTCQRRCLRRRVPQKRTALFPAGFVNGLGPRGTGRSWEVRLGAAVH